MRARLLSPSWAALLAWGCVAWGCVAELGVDGIAPLDVDTPAWDQGADPYDAIPQRDATQIGRAHEI
ncbi:hypothetical protein KJ940_10815, partial [Myxococcota bacterium]|nr:hypothetical protein [Myxococcota bacterium]